MPIWTDDYLAQQYYNAGQDIARNIDCIWQRFTFPIMAGQSVYTLPCWVRTVMDIQFFGYSLDKANWDDLTVLTPATVFVSPGNAENIETTPSQRPLWYGMHPTNLYDVRFVPTPSLNMTSDETDNPYATDNSPKCIVTCFRKNDDNDPAGILPSYADRRTRKAYALSKAFRVRGKGQNLKAAAYYDAKYKFLLKMFEQINTNPYIGKRYSLDDGNLCIDSFRYPRPTLPPTFERVVY